MSLGRGLDSLIPKKIITPTAPAPDRPDETLSGERIYQLSPNEVAVNPHQPRKEFAHAALENLINSIKEHGILQPLIVTKINTGYELIAGERRLRAAKVLGLATVPAVVRQASENEKLELAIIENVQRQDLNPLEEAFAYQRLLDEFSLTQERVAERVGKSRASVANILRLLNLPEEIQMAIAAGQISSGHAKVLAGVEDPGKLQQLFAKILRDELNVRETEGEARQLKPASAKSLKNIVLPDAQTLAQEEALRSGLGTKVKIEKKGEGGKVIIEFYSEEELRDLVKKISGYFTI